MWILFVAIKSERTALNEKEYLYYVCRLISARHGVLCFYLDAVSSDTGAQHSANHNAGKHFYGSLAFFLKFHGGF